MKNVVRTNHPPGEVRALPPETDESPPPLQSSTQIRLFLTCWLVFVLHFATDFTREHFLVLSIVDDFSFRLDEYVGFHDDIFLTPDRGAHHNANPGASMIGAIPYFVLKPVVNAADRIFSGKKKGEEAVYKDHRPARVAFYENVRQRGLDIKFGLVALVTMVFCMAPLSAFGVLLMFRSLTYAGIPFQLSLWMAFLYGFGTPVFFRTAYLNHNLMVGIFAFAAFVLIWQAPPENFAKRSLAAGFLGGLTLLCDYSGIIVLLTIGFYVLIKRYDTVSFRTALKDGVYYLAGAMGPVILLWFYQWKSFGHPFYPPQHHMRAVVLSEIGYRGFGMFSIDLLWMNLFDPRFGLFVVSPILILSFLTLFRYFRKNLLRQREASFAILFFAALLIFFGFVQYTRWQWITGIRFLIPAVPFLFLATAVILVPLPRWLLMALSVFTIIPSWCLAMARSQEGPWASVKQVFTEGLQLPWVNTLSKMSVAYVPFLSARVAVIPILLIGGLLVYGIWRFRRK